jgi:hypothetical protein
MSGIGFVGGVVGIAGGWTTGIVGAGVANGRTAGNIRKRLSGVVCSIPGGDGGARLGKAGGVSGFTCG